MKKINSTFFSLLLSLALLGQAPKAFNYQGVARDLSGSPIPNQLISLQIAILQGSTNGSEAYKETHFVTTNNLGLFNIKIGDGTPVSGIFGDIEWGSQSHFIQLEIDENGGNDFQLIGTSELLSVPYAIYAEKSGSSLWNKLQNNDINYDAGFVRIGQNTNNRFAPLSISGFNSSTPFKGQIMILNDEFSSDSTASVGLITAYGSNVQQNNVATGRLWAIGSQSTSNKNLLISNDLEGAILFGVNGNFEAMLLDENGNLGIGTIEPQYTIHGVNGGGQFYSRIGPGYNPNTNISVMFQGSSEPNAIAGFAFDAIDGDGVGVDYGTLYQYDNGNIELSNKGNNDLTLSTNNEGRITIKANGDIGIGVFDPKAKLQVANGDVYIENISNGVIMKSSNGQCWRYTPNNSGQLTPTAITCPN